MKIFCAKNLAKPLAMLMAFMMVFSLVMGNGVQVAYASEDGTGEAAGETSSGGKTVNDLFGDAMIKPGQVGTGLDGQTDLNTVVSKSQEVARTVTSILSILCLISLLFWVAQLAMSAGNPNKRQTAITGILFSGIALAVFGGSWVVVNFFWNFLSGM